MQKRATVYVLSTVTRETEKHTMRSELGDEEVITVERASREGNTENQPVLAFLEDLCVRSLPHLLQERDKVLWVLCIPSTLWVTRAI